VASALCADDEVDPRWWDDPESGVDATDDDALLASLICERCPLRRKRLETALQPIEYVVVIEERGRARSAERELDRAHRIYRIWAATTMRERAGALLGRSLEEAAEQLEAELPARIERRLEAWKRTPGRPAELIEPLLAARKQAS
jgi:hypothetical protein